MRIPPNILFGNKINTFGTNRLSRLAQLGHKFALPSAPRFYTQHFSRHHLSSKSNGCEIASDLEPENNKSHAPKESKDNNDKARSSGLETYWTEAREEYESLGRARSKIVRYISALLTIFVSALAFAYTYRRQSRSFEIYEEKFTANVTQTGKPDIGGSWTLTDHNNKSISSESLQGNWIIYYFGFVNCPDICPEEMEKIAALVRRTKKKLGITNIVPVFVSVDPERDDYESIKQYIANYSDDFIGLTGKPEEIASVTKKYRIFYSRGDKDELGNYQVDHSICSYLFYPDGTCATYFMRSELVSDRLEKIRKYSEKFNAQDKSPVLLK